MHSVVCDATVFFANLLLCPISVLLKFLFLQGFRTLEDIRTKAHLSAIQKIGLKHYDDFLDRMPRDEAAAIEAVVMDLYFDIFSSLSFSLGTTKLFVHIRDELGQ